MIHFITYWLPTILVWLTFCYQIRQILLVRRRRKVNAPLTLAEIADEHGLTPVQVRVALDVAESAFLQRVAEMRRANHAR
jgi:hypothetical protein